MNKITNNTTKCLSVIKDFLCSLTESNDQVAKEILSQIRAQDKWALGAWGARDYVFDGNSISFKVRGSKMKSGGSIKVELDTGTDTYNVIAYRIRNYEVKELKHVKDVYDSQLVKVIDSIVG